MFKYLFHKCMKFVGITLIIFFMLLYIMIFYSYIYDLCQLYYLYFEQSILKTLPLLIAGYYLAFCILFNYFMGIFVHPGKNTVIKNRSYKLNGQDDSDDEEEIEPNNFRNMQNKKPSICRKCNEFKPDRAHHCTICNECVYKMDHHCPWLDNCVGYENHRYFLSFIIYLMIAMIYISMLFAYIDNNPSKFDHMMQLCTRIYPAVRLLAYVLAFVLIVFNAWNWYLATTGYTAIEFWDRNSTGREPTQKCFAYPTVRENLFQIFGTISYFKMLLPSIRPLPHDGTKWEQSNSVTQSTSSYVVTRDLEEQQQARNRKGIMENNNDEYDDADEEQQKFNSFENNYNRNKNGYREEEDDDIEGGL